MAGKEGGRMKGAGMVVGAMLLLTTAACSTEERLPLRAMPLSAVRALSTYGATEVPHATIKDEVVLTPPVCAKSFKSKACQKFFKQPDAALVDRIQALLLPMHKRLFVAIDKAAKKPGSPWYHELKLLNAGNGVKHDFLVEDSGFLYTIQGETPNAWVAAESLRFNRIFGKRSLDGAPVMVWVAAARGVPERILETMVLQMEVLDPQGHTLLAPYKTSYPPRKLGLRLWLKGSVRLLAAKSP